jgi:hypothetical protein
LYHTANTEPDEWTGLLVELLEIHGSCRFGASDALSVMRSCGLLGHLWSHRGDLAAQQHVGRAMSNQRDRVFGKLRLRTNWNARRKAHEYFIESAPP